MLKKLLASIVLAAFLLVTSVPSVYAQPAKNWYFQSWEDWYAKVYDDQNPDEIFGERYTAAQVEWVIYGIGAFIINHLIGDGTLVGCIARNVFPFINELGL